MAKLKSLFNVEGTFGGMTHVRSKTYGNHIRAVRGTHKLAEVNAAFKASGQQLIKANEMAKLILDGINPYRQDFKGGLLWQRLVSLFKGQYKATGAFNPEALAGFEVWKEYPLNRFFKGRLDFTVTVGDNLTVELNYDFPPDFKRKFADCLVLK